MMVPLNLPPAPLKLTRKNGQVYVQCLIRRKSLLLTPEEWVRQHLIHYLVQEEKIPMGRIAVEMTIAYNTMQRRCDLVVFDEFGTPKLIVECKAPEVKLREQVFLQIAQYNATLQVPYLIVSNGLEHVILNVDSVLGSVTHLNALPPF